VLLQHIIKSFDRSWSNHAPPNIIFSSDAVSLHINTKKAGYDGLLGKTCSGQFTTTCSLKDEEKRDKNRERRRRKGERICVANK